MLNDIFKFKELGQLKYFLGLEIAHSELVISVCQRKYALDILETTGLLALKLAKFPINPNVKFSKDSGHLLADPTSYRWLVGRLLYLTISRPDISFVVQVLSQFMDKPRVLHLDASTQVLRYIKATPAQGLFFPVISSLQLKAFCDSDWAGCLDSRRSVTGYCIFLDSSLISWKSKKQTIVSWSSAKAEYRAMTSTCCEVVWFRTLLHDLQIPLQTALLNCDSKILFTLQPIMFSMSVSNTLTLIAMWFMRKFNHVFFALFMFLLNTNWLTFLQRLLVPLILIPYYPRWVFITFILLDIFYDSHLEGAYWIWSVSWSLSPDTIKKLHWWVEHWSC